METKIIRPPNFGWIESTLNQEIINFLWERIKEAKEVHKKHLAGNISNSLLIEDKENYFFSRVLSKLINLYIEKFGYPFSRQTVIDRNQICLERFWVNYQFQNEFNPFHDHTGIFSFAIWLKIPASWKEQNKLKFLDGITENQKKAGCFEFQYINTTGTIQHFAYRLDKSYEGKMLFFPASLQHAVHPFYKCDEPRISIAGNISVK